MSLNQTANAVRHQIEQYAENVTGCLAELPDERIWSAGPDGSNSIGTLTHHLSGNLRHFLGAGLLKDGYQRDRPAEFADRGLTAQQLTEELQKAVAVAREALETVTAQMLEAPHQSIDGRDFPSLVHMLTMIAAHFAYHTGQINYTTRIWREQA